MEPSIVPQYPACDHIKRCYSTLKPTDEELIAGKHEALPIYEQNLFDYNLIKNSSLTRNELLKCRWAEFLKHLDGRIRTPFKFPSVNNFHFCRNLVRYEPSETIMNRVSNRYTLKCGPGVDAYGQVPIPNDAHLRKSHDTADAMVKLQKDGKK